MKRIFIHIPKNAGSALKLKLRDIGVVAINPRNANKCMKPGYKIGLERTFTGNNQSGMKPNYTHCRWVDLSDEMKKLQAFAIIRNPWDRVVSRYLFREVLRNEKKIVGYKTFEQFLEERHIDGGKKYFWHRAVQGWYDQRDYVSHDGVLKCDILRYEHLNKDVRRYLNLSESFTLIWKNVSNGLKNADRTAVSGRQDYRTFYNETTKQIVADWYANDIDFFGFTFDGPATRNIWSKG